MAHPNRMILLLLSLALWGCEETPTAPAWPPPLPEGQVEKPAQPTPPKLDRPPLGRSVERTASEMAFIERHRLRSQSAPRPIPGSAELPDGGAAP